MKFFKKISESILIVFLLLITFSGKLFSQQFIVNKSYLPKDSNASVVLITPEKPVLGDKIKVKFFPSENSEVKDTDSLFIDVLFLFKEHNYFMQEYLMNRDSIGWSVSFILDDDRVGSMVFQFSTPDFSKVDCNGEVGWDLMVYNENGIPVKGAFSAYANGYMTHGLIKRRQDINKYIEGKLAELKAYPEDPINLANTWYFRRGKEDFSKIKKEIDSVTNRFPQNIELLESAYNKYSEMRDTVNQQIIYDKIIKIDPHNSIAIWKEREKIFFDNPDLDKIYSYKELIIRAKGTDAFNELQRDYFQTLKKAKYYEQAAAFIKEWEKPDITEIVVTSTWILYDCFQYDNDVNKIDLPPKIYLGKEAEKLDKMINLGISFAKAGIAVIERSDINNRKNEFAPHHWNAEKKRFLGFAYCNLGFASYLLNDNQSAKLYYGKARSILGKDFYSQHESYYILLLKMGEYNIALEDASKAMNLYPENKEFYSKIISIAAKKRL